MNALIARACCCSKSCIFYNLCNNQLYFVQGRDNDTWIAMTKSLNTIHALYGRDTEVPGGGEVDPEVDTIYSFICIALSAFQ